MLNDSIPYKLHGETDSPRVQWLKIGNSSFKQPFFQDTAISRMAHYSAQGIDPFSFSGLNEVLTQSNNANSIQPSLFIFHTSRCGSTLASQLLATNDENIVVPEYPFLDSVLQHFDGTPELEKYLNATLCLIGRKKNEVEKRLFLKMDSWHISHCQVIRQFYPNTPFLFLYRNPDETITSLKKLPGLQSSNGILKPSIFGFGDDYVFESVEAHLNHVLTAYYERIHQWAEVDPLTSVVEYDSSFTPFIDYCEATFGSDIWNRGRILKRINFHSKKPNNAFKPEKPSKPLATVKTQRAYEFLKPLNWQHARNTILQTSFSL